MIYNGKDGALEYDFVGKPGTNPSSIHLAFTGQRRMRMEPNGDLVLETVGGDVRQAPH